MPPTARLVVMLAALAAAFFCTDAAGVDTAALAGLDLDPGLRHFLGSMLSDLEQAEEQTKGELSQVKAELAEFRAEMHEEKVALRAEMVALENKTQTRVQGLETEVHELRAVLYMFSKQTRSRLDQCETETTPFVQLMQRRQMQAATARCQGDRMQAMLNACCTGGHRRSNRRFLQSNLLEPAGCSGFPATRSIDCSPLLIEFYEGCQHIILEVAPAEQQDFTSFYSLCNVVAHQTALAVEGASPVRQFRVVVIDEEAEQQAALANGGASPAPSFGPVNLPPPPP